MQRLNSPDQTSVYHYLTLNVRDRRTAFGCARHAQMIAELLRYECDRHPAQLAAFVVMPEHLHTLLAFEDGQLSRFLKRFKANATHNLDALIEQHGNPRQSDWLCEKGRRELWQDGKHSIPIYSPRWVKQKIEYIHQNPVARGLVETPGDYLWSSFGAYFPDSGHVPLVPIDIAAAW